MQTQKDKGIERSKCCGKFKVTSWNVINGTKEKCFCGKPFEAEDKIEEESWEKKFDEKFENILIQDIYGNFTDDTKLKQFITQTLIEEKEKWGNERLSALKLCPQCHTMKNMTRELCFRCLDRNEIREEVTKEMLELFSKKTMNEKGEPICPKCGKDMERDCQEPNGHLWFCPCMKGLRLSVG